MVMARVRTHPGEVLREEFLAPLGLSSHQLADAIDVPANRISEIVREARSVTADTALRLADHFKTTPEFWMNLQSAHDLSKARAEVEAGAPKRRYAKSLHIEGLKPGMAYGLATNKRDSNSGEFTKGQDGSKTSQSAKQMAASALTQRERSSALKSSKASRKDNPSGKK